MINVKWIPIEDLKKSVTPRDTCKNFLVWFDCDSIGFAILHYEEDEEPYFQGIEAEELDFEKTLYTGDLIHITHFAKLTVNSPLKDNAPEDVVDQVLLLRDLQKELEGNKWSFEKLICSELLHQKEFFEKGKEGIVVFLRYKDILCYVSKTDEYEDRLVDIKMGFATYDFVIEDLFLENYEKSSIDCTIKLDMITRT